MKGILICTILTISTSLAYTDNLYHPTTFTRASSTRGRQNNKAQTVNSFLTTPSTFSDLDNNPEYESLPTRAAITTKFPAGHRTDSRNPVHDNGQEQGNTRTSPGGGRDTYSREQQPNWPNNSVCGLPICRCDKKWNEYIVDCTCTAANREFSLYNLPGQGWIPHETTELRIRKCFKATLLHDALAHLSNLQKVTFSDIATLRIESNGVYIPTALLLPIQRKVEIRSCGVDAKYKSSFRGYLGDLVFDTITNEGTLQQGFFSELRLNSLTVEKWNLAEVKTGAFQNCAITRFKLSDSSIGIVQENGLKFAGIEDFKITNNTIGTLGSNAIDLEWEPKATPGFTFSQNTVAILSTNAFSIRISGPVLFEDNLFKSVQKHALYNISRLKTKHQSDFKFTNNELRKYEYSALSILKEFKERDLVMQTLKLPDSCSCSMGFIVAHLFGNPLGEPSGKAMNNESHLLKKMETTNEGHEQALMCMSGMHVYIREYENKNCVIQGIPVSILVYQLAIPATAIFLLIILIILIVFLCKRTRKLKYTEKRTERLAEQITSLELFGPILWSNRQKAEQNSLAKQQLVEAPTLPKRPGEVNPWVLAVPEQKTYKQTELEVIAETTQPIEEPHIYMTLESLVQK